MTAARRPDILIIDDNRIDREAIRRSLRESAEGREAALHEADSGKAGLALLRQKRFACVFLDYLLPDMNGLRVLREIYDADQGGVTSPVVMLTGQGSEPVMLEALRYGALDYIQKDNISAASLGLAMKKAQELFELKEGRRQAEGQLQHMHKMDAIGQLTSGIAHDFNNLLTVVLGNLHLLRQRIESKPDAIDPAYALKKIQTMETVARNGADLVRRLMVFTRQRPLKQEVVDLDACIGETCEILRRSLGEAVKIEVKHGRGVFPVFIDPVEFGNVLINMAVNARDAMPEGGTLTLSTENAVLDGAGQEQAKPGDYALVTVSDTGAGMDPDTLARIFEPFFTTKAPGEGTGLGLSMAYGFVKQSGGHIMVESRRNEGTTFRIYLPRAEAAASPAAPEKERRNA